MKTNKKKIVIWIVVAIIVCFSCMFFYMNSGERKEIKELLVLGNKYMDELDYEEAIVMYTNVLQIDPKNKKALLGIENASVQYADTLLTSVTEVDLEEYYALRDVLNSNSILVESSLIKRKLEEIEDTINKREEEINKVEKEKEEERIRKEEEEKKEKEEKKAKEEVKKGYAWLIEQIYGKYDEYCQVQFKKEENDKYIYGVSYGVCVIEKETIEINKKSEQGIVTEHLVEDFENGGWMDVEKRTSHVGKEYDLKVTDEILQQYKDYMKYSLYANGAYMEAVTEYLLNNWDKAAEENMIVLSARATQAEGEDYSIWDIAVTLGQDWMSTTFDFDIRLDVINKQANIERFREEFDSWSENIPIESIINLSK